MAYDPNAHQISRTPAEASAASYQREANMAPAFAGMTPAVAREVATIQGQIMLAKMFPRNMAEVWKKVEAACSRKKLAENALYQYSRGGTDITGPSIRLAEALINAYGNAKSGFEVIDSNPEYSRVRAYAYDMETNTLQERTFDVEHIRQTKTGRTKLTDPRDIYETVANNASRRERACILALIPGDLQDYAVNLCKTTLEKAVDITPDKIEGLCRGLAKFGVSKTMIEARIQRHIDAITAQQYVWLCSVGTSLKEGVAKVDDFFDRNAKPIGQAEVQASPAKTAEAPKKRAAAKTQQKPEPEAKPEPQAAEDVASSASIDVPDDIWNTAPGTRITEEGELIEESPAESSVDPSTMVTAPEDFQDDSMEDFYDED